MARAADRVLAVSEFTKREAVELLGVPAERVTVIGNAVEPVFAPEGPAAEGDYVLAVGTLEPRKNLRRAAAAAERAGAELRVVGARGWGGVELPGWVGEVPDGELAALYRGARCLVFPSLYEGFGIPVLEAMACGTPVVTSAGGATAEVAGGAAVLVDQDPEQEAGRVTALPDRNRDGKADERITVADGLTGPNSVFIQGKSLIVGEHTGITEITLGENYKVTERKALVPNLPIGTSHRTKTAVVGADGRLYVAMGSTCNACNESEPRHAAVWVYERDGSNGRLYAKGLRNAVGLALNPWTGEIWATNNGRDLLGDTEPPETLYSLRDGGDYGWPRCHGGDPPPGAGALRIGLQSARKAAQ